MKIRRGFTLMEILAVLSIMAAVGSVGVSTAGNFYANQQATAMAAELAGDVRLARSTSISQGCYTRIVFNSDLTAWVVQELRDATDNLVVGEPTTVLSPTDRSAYAEEPTYWRSIIDSSIREVPADVFVSFNPSTVPIFFKSDGTTREDLGLAAPLGVVTVSFNYGAATCSVDIMPSGVVESVLSFEEEY